jgi:hypothetical protein
MVTNELLNFDLEFSDWGRLAVKQPSDALMKGAMVAVNNMKRHKENIQQQMTRLVSD